MIKMGTERILCAAAVVGACALIVLATHHTAAEEPAAAEAAPVPAVASAPAAPASPAASSSPTEPATLVRAHPASQPARVDPTRAGRLLAQLQTLRSQFELWKLQHEDRMPDLKRFADWQQFTQRTSVRGDLKDRLSKGGFGPYLVEPPRNAINNLSAVAMSGDDIKLDQLTLDRPAGFVLSLPSGRLFGTDTSGNKVIADASLDRIYQSQFAETPASSASPPTPASPMSSSRNPSMMRDSREDRLASLLDQLNTMQAQLLLYKLQHRDALPDLVKMSDWQQLTGRTDSSGRMVEKGEFGPYLRGIPRNPLTGDHRVALTTAGRQTAKQLRDGRIGYVLDPKTTQLWAVDENGKCIAIRRVESGS